MKFLTNPDTTRWQKLLPYFKGCLIGSLGLFSSASAAPVAMAGPGSYTQNFDALPILEASPWTPWTDDTTLPGWYAGQSAGTLSVIRGSTGSSGTGAFYSFGANAATERALGSIGSGTPQNFAYGVLLRNTSSGPLQINSIAYTGEQWRNGGNVTPQVVAFTYNISSTPISSAEPGSVIPSGSFVFPALDFTSPINTATAATLDGNLPANRVAVSANPKLGVAAGQYIFLRWYDPNHDGADHGLAIDDLTVAWIIPPSPVLTVSATPDTFLENAGAGASTGTVSIPAALPNNLVVTLASGDSTKMTLPATATILAGQTSRTFPITAVDNFLANNDAPVNIIANATGYLQGQFTVTIENDVDTPINVSVTPQTFLESAGATAALGTVTIAQNTVGPLDIDLTSLNVARATVPSSVTILAGQNSATFPVAAVNNTIPDGNATFNIRAEAEGYTRGQFLITVNDDGDLPDPPTIPIGGIAFTGFASVGDDYLSFVALVPIPGGAKILFTDNEWNGQDVGSGGGFVDSNEGLVTWTAPAEGVPVGTIISLSSLSFGTPVANIGTAVDDNGFNLSTSDGDSVYAFQGAESIPTRVLAVVQSIAGESIVGTGVAQALALPTGINIAAYNGLRNNQATYPAYIPGLYNVATNWITQDSGFNDHTDGTAPDVPFDTTPFTLSGPSNVFSTWIAGFSVGGQTGINGDFDDDGLDNAVENILGTNPSVSNPGLTMISGTSTSVKFRHTKADTPVTDLTASYEWSTDLLNWFPSGPGGGITVSIPAPVVITDGSPNDIVEVTATVTAGTAPRLFVRLKAIKP